MNGFRAILYCYGLSASRYVEYAYALNFLSPKVKEDSTILEMGCGHSILPTFWQRKHSETIILDLNRSALEWQKGMSNKISKTLSHTILADMRYLPFENESIDCASCISAIEHIAGDGDVKAASELGRVLRKDAICIISVPLSLSEKSFSHEHWTTGIPPVIQRLFKPVLPIILGKLGVDRTSSYFERFFSLEDVQKRIIGPSKALKEDQFTLESRQIVKIVHQKIIPTSVITLLEYFLAKFFIIDKKTKTPDAIMLKLRKPT